jgi:hypothetical protein
MRSAILNRTIDRIWTMAVRLSGEGMYLGALSRPAAARQNP